MEIQREEILRLRNEDNAAISEAVFRQRIKPLMQFVELLMQLTKLLMQVPVMPITELLMLVTEQQM